MLRFAIVIFAATCAYGLPQDLIFGGQESRIVGGAKAELGQFPYQAELYLHNQKMHQCGGTILNSRWIITAAHCVRTNYASDFTIKLGTTTLDAGGDSYAVERIVVHPDDTPSTKQNDVALVRTSTDIIFRDTIQPIPIADYEVPDDAEVVVSGWGFNYWGSDVVTPNDLYFIKLKTYNNAKCGLQMIWLGTVTKDQICTYTGRGEGVCGGDSGGPLVHEGHLAGVVSWGKPCGAGYPDIYSKASVYLDWVQETIA